MNINYIGYKTILFLNLLKVINIPERKPYKEEFSVYNSHRNGGRNIKR